MRTNLFALDAANGGTIWSKQLLGGETFAPLIIANGVLYTADAAGRLRALRASNGEELFVENMTTGDSQALRGLGLDIKGLASGMSISDGKLFVTHGIYLSEIGNIGGVNVYSLADRDGADTKPYAVGVKTSFLHDTSRTFDPVGAAVQASLPPESRVIGNLAPSHLPQSA